MSQIQSPRPIELLAPARDAQTAIEAIRHGADAVYIGGPSHGARASAGNSLDDIRRVMEHGGVDRIMFDNFPPELTKEAVKMVGGKYETESSGGITLGNLREYGEAGVDYISVGALTHSVKGLDMSFKAF